MKPAKGSATADPFSFAKTCYYLWTPAQVAKLVDVLP